MHIKDSYVSRGKPSFSGSGSYGKLLKECREEAVGQVDQAEVERFLTDSKQYGDWMAEGYKNMTYTGASDTAITNERKRRSDEMAIRANRVRAWLQSDQNSLTPESSRTVSSYLDDFRKFQEDSQNSYTHKQKTVQRYGSEEAWGKALRQSGYQEKYGQMSKQDLNAAAAALPDGEEKQWLNDYYGEALRSEADYDHEIAMINWQLGRLGKVYDDFSNTTRWVQDESDEQLNQKIDRYRENYGSPQAVKKQMEQLQTRRYHLEQGKKYNLIPQNEDFTEKAKYSGDGSYLQNMVNNPKTADGEDTAKHIFTAADPVVIGGIIDAVSYENVHLMTAEERMIFNYLHNTKGEKSAKEYMDWLQYTLNQRSAMKLNNWVADRTRDIPVLSQVWASRASVPLRFMGGSGILDAAGQKVVNAITGDDKPVDYNRDAMMISQASSTVRSSVARQLNDVASIKLDKEKHPILASWFNGVGIGDLYSVGMSMVDSSVVAAATAINPIAGQVASALLSASSATDTMLQSAANGATDGQAITAGLAAGFFEWFFEKYEIESLMKQGKSVRTAMLKQGFNEAVGEGATELCNIVTNTWLMAENSDWKKKAEEYLKQNPKLDRSQAENLAMMDMVMQVLKASAAGFFTGAVMGGAAGAVNTVRFNADLQKLYSGAAPQMVSNLLAADPENALGLKLEKKLSDGKELSGAELQKLLTALETQEAAGQTDSAVAQLMEGIEPVNKGTTPRQPGSEAISDLVDESVAQLTGAPTSPVEAALEGFRSTGAVTNKQATDILNNAAAVQQLVREAGLKLPETASGKRAAVKEAVSRLAQSETGVDTAPDAVYDEENVNGGMNYGQGLQSDDRSGGIGDPSQGVAGVQQGNGSGAEGWGQRDRVAVNSGVLRISDELTTAQQKRGTVTYSVQETTENPSGYEQALTAGRNSDPVNGWCVTPKTADELQENGIRTFMNENGTVGVGIAPDGDIVAVFKNKNGGPRKAMDTMMPIAIEQGGDRLDCYGAGLVKVYEAYGFVPVARVEFNPEYANEGWMPERGTPFIYFMMHNGDSAPTVAEKMGNYPHLSKNELDALPTYSKDDYDAAMAYRDSLIDKRRNSSTESVSAAFSESVDNVTGKKKSKLYANTYKNATDAAVRSIGEVSESLDSNIAYYTPITEKGSLSNAADRVRTKEDIDRQYQLLVHKEGWTGEDNDTAMLVLDYMRRNGETQRFRELAKAQRKQATQGGQLIQSFAKYTKTPTSAALSAMETLDNFTQNDISRKFWRRKSFDEWKDDVAASILDIANRIEEVGDGNVNEMRSAIRALAKFRKTTAWFGTSSNLTKVAEKALSKINFNTAKDIAIAQLSQIPGDFRKRSIGEVVKTIRIYNMLSSLTTVNRNLSGNASIGIVDALSDSTVGRALDALVSLWTKKRTVGNDVIHGKTYFKASVKAVEMAALCAELDIPMESESRFSAGASRTFSPRGGPVTRFLSAYEKGMKYALEVTDKFFEGGARSAVEKSLRNLGEKSNLTEDEISALSQKTGQRRTFKDDRTITRATKGIKKALNEFGTGNIGIGDFAIPFAGTGSNVTHAAIDYTGGGVFTGLYELAKIARDVKNGEKVDVVRQRKAVTDVARSITGIGLISAFAALAAKGIIKVHNDGDKDERALDQSQNLAGAQFNVDAMLRAFAGEDTTWQEDDWTVSIDFLEPFNAQMYVGYILSQEDSVADVVKTYPEAAASGAAQSILDMPMMQNLSDAVDLASGALESFEEGDEDALSDAAGQLLGNYGSGFIPSWVRQTAYMTDPYYRDTTGGNAMEKAVNQMKSNIPGLSQTLPMKYSGLGEEQVRHEGGLSGFLNTYVNPGKVSQISTSDIANGLDHIAEATGKKTIYPDYIAPGSFTYTDEDGKKQTVTITGKEMTETYQKTYGENIAGLYSALLSMDDFNSLDEHTQAKIMEGAKKYATQIARTSVLPEYQPDIPKYLTGIGDDPETLALVMLTYSHIDSIDGISSSEQARKWAYQIDQHEAAGLITSEQKSVLLEHTPFYVSVQANASEYSKMTAAGISTKTADYVADLMRDIQPEPGRSSVRTVQKLEAITEDTDLSDQDLEAIIPLYLSEGQQERFGTAMDRGYSPEEFVEAYRVVLDKEKGQKKPSVIREIAAEAGITYGAAKRLYEIMTEKIA